MGRGRTGTGVDALKTCIRLRFTWAGRRWTETLAQEPTPANLRAAVRLADRIKKEVEIGVFDYAVHFPGSPNATSEATTFKRYARLYQDTLVSAHSTLATYKVPIGRWTAVFGHMQVSAIKVTDIASAVADASRSLAPATVNTYVSVLRSILQLAMDDGVIQGNPADRIKSAKNQRAEPEPFTPDETARIVAWLWERAPAQVAGFYEFAFLTGLRPSEQIALRWGRIDWGTKTMTVDVAHVRSRDKVTKTARVRRVDLGDRAMAVLTSMKAHTWLKGLDAHVFVNPLSGQPWATNDVLRANYFHPCLKALGLRKRDAYQTRHTYATTLLMGGINVAYIARQLGHASVTMTLLHYAKWVEAADKGAEAKKVNLLFGQELVTAKRKHLKSLD